MPGFENELILVSLPDSWTDESDDHTLSFLNHAAGEELTITLGQFKKRLDAQELSELVWNLLTKKVAALAQVSAGTMEILDGTQPPPSMPYQASFSSIDSANGVFAKVLFVGHSNHFFSSTYYKHGATSATPDMAQRANAILATCADKLA